MSAWRPWGPDVFALARERSLPVLAAAGRRPPADLAASADALERLFVTALADPDLAPDAAARLGEGRVVVLDATGARCGVLPLPAPGLEAELERLAGSARGVGRPDPGPGTTAPVWTGAVGAPAPASFDPARPAAVFAALAASVAPEDDGLEALLHAAGEGRVPGAREALTRGVEALLARSWSTDRRAFVENGDASLALNARRARLLWNFHALTGESAARARAEEATRFLLRELRDRSRGAFRALPAPGSALYPADGNALAALALMRASAFGVSEAEAGAADALAFLQTKLYDPMLGMVHAFDGDRPLAYGLLGDAVWTALAFCEAYLATGLKTHREFSDQLLRFLFQELWERERGGFLDRVTRSDDPELMREPRVDPSLNALALELCWRLHHLKGNANYRRWLDWGLKGAWPSAFGDPAREAGLARVADMAARGRMDFELIGRPGEPRADALLGAVLRLHLPRKVVSFVDPDDQDYILAHKLDGAGYPRLFACGPDLRRVADTDDPARVGELVAALAALEGRA